MSERHVRKLDRLFEALRSGRRNAEIVEEVEVAEASDRQAEFRAHESEEMARELISRLPYVDEVQRKSASNKHDPKKHDLRVHFDGVEYAKRFDDLWIHEGDFVWVQVKSSQPAVDKFYQSIMHRQHVDIAQAMYIVKNSLLVVVNPRVDERTFYQNFEEQILKINDFWRIKNPPRSSRYR